MSNLSKIKPKLRTQGRVTGNFGRNKVEGKRQTLELSEKTLSRDNLRIPDRESVYSRLLLAYNITTDPKMKEFLFRELQKREAQKIRSKPPSKAQKSEFWEEVKLVR